MSLSDCSVFNNNPRGGGGEGYCHIWAIKVCAVKGMVFQQLTLG